MKNEKAFRDKVTAALENAAQSKYGDLVGRCLGLWELGFEAGRDAVIKSICEELGLPVPRNRKRL